MTYRTANLQSCILYIYSTNIGTEYFKRGIYSPFVSSIKCSLFHNSNIFCSCNIHILYTGCAKIKNKKIRCQKTNQPTLLTNTPKPEASLALHVLPSERYRQASNQQMSRTYELLFKNMYSNYRIQQFTHK